MMRQDRSRLFVSVQNRHLQATNDGSERAPRPCAVFRTITDGVRQERGAHLDADVGSVIGTARRRSVRAIDAMGLTRPGVPIGVPA